MFLIKYYRTVEVAQAWLKSGVDKPAGWVFGKAVYPTASSAQRDLDIFTGQGILAEIVTMQQAGR